MKIKTVFQTFRPSFLVLAPICVFLGISTSLEVQSQVSLFMALLVLMVAILAHISVNTFNEYYDFRSGLDLLTIRTPFSGGSGTLPIHPEMAGITLAIAIVSLLLTVLIGIYLVLQRGFIVMPIGIVGVVLILTYTQWLNRLPLLGVIASGSGFGILMVVGTHVVLTGGYSSISWLLSLVPFFLVNNLLLLNQYPDIEADESVGRKTFPIAFGVKKSNFVYAAFMLAAYSVILLLIIKQAIPELSAIAIIPMALSIFALLGATKHESNIGAFPQYLAANVAATLLTPVLLGLSLVFG